LNIDRQKPCKIFLQNLSLNFIQISLADSRKVLGSRPSGCLALFCHKNVLKIFEKLKFEDDF
jgi:hypothetical protein